MPPDAASRSRFALDLSVFPRVARYTFRRQAPGQVAMGAMSGVVNSLAAFVAMRTLGAGPWVAPAFVVIGQFPWLFAPLWERRMTTSAPRRVFLKVGALATLPVLAIAFVDPQHGDAGPDPIWLTLFFAALALSYSVNGAYQVHRMALVRANYAASIRGRVFGVLYTLTAVAGIASSKAAGALLDQDPALLRVVFPAAALVGFLDAFLLSRIRWRGWKRQARQARENPPSGGRGRRLVDSLKVLGRDRDFALFETAFMLYGFAFLMSKPMLAVFGERDLHASYAAWTWADGVASPLAMVVCLPLTGRLVDRIGITRTAAIAFGLLGTAMLSLAFVESTTGLVVSCAMFGAAMSGVNVAWTLGPLHFAKDGRTHAYTSVHVFLVGVRSVIAPGLGYAIASLTNVRVTFLVAAGFLVCATLTMRRLGKRTAAV